VENYETFFARVRPALSPDDLLDLDLAYTLAKHAHRWQCRKEIDAVTGKPVRYFEHLRAVALILIDEVGCLDPAMIMAALLHDSREDTRLTPEMIERKLSRDVAVMVKMLSKVPKEGYMERLMTYADWRTLMVKACDRLHNLRTLSQADEAFQRKQVTETADKYYALLDRMVDLAPPEHKTGAKYLRREIKKTVRGFEKTLNGQVSKAAAARRRR
jgi:(p)ppGpp synthase/HD superfamily hydrolase